MIRRSLSRCNEKRTSAEAGEERFSRRVLPEHLLALHVGCLEAGAALVVAAGRARVADDDHASALAAGGSSGHFGGWVVVVVVFGGVSGCLCV